ncbi:MAG: copper resistance protein CopC [Chloroflexi bacterium]|nr:copper resistance protein CopC [Chloroflexota bacterium]
MSGTGSAGNRRPGLRLAAARVSRVGPSLAAALALALVRIVAPSAAGLTGGAASAHGETVESQPAPGAVLDRAPAEVELRFTAALGEGSAIEVLDAGFQAVEAGETRIDPTDPERMRVSLPPLPPGDYTVQWLAVDARDRHRTQGSYAFTLRPAGGGLPGPGAGLGSALGYGLGALVLILLLALGPILRRRARSGAPSGLGWRRLRLVCLLPGLILGACRFESPTPAVETVREARAWPLDPSAETTRDAEGLAAEGSAGPEAEDAGEPAAAGLQVVIASTDLAQGRERFAFGLLDGAGELLPGATVQLHWFFLAGQGAEPAGEAEAIWYPSTLPGAGLYVASADFDRPGVWGAEFEIRLPDGSRPAPQRLRFPVSQVPASPGLGEPAPPTENRTLADGLDIAALTSDPAPDPDLYRMTVDAAAASGRPTVLVFATPAFCQTRLCGPVVDEIKALKADYGDRANFIHIEVYQRFEPLEFADEMADWGLSTEPWVFVLDHEGRVAARLEGSVTRAELEPILAGLLGESPPG